MGLRHRRLACAVLCLVLASCSVLLAQEPRTLTPDDLFKIEGILFSHNPFSPDGQTVAYVRRRSIASALESRAKSLSQFDYDIWLAPVTGGAPVNLTQGATSGSGFWNPTWSPDGARLAMVSPMDGINKLWVWEKATGRLIKLSDRGVEDRFPPGPYYPQFAWIDPYRIAVLLRPNGYRADSMWMDQQAEIVALREWQKRWAGRETTASVLDSGVAADLASRVQVQLTILDVRGGGAQPVETSAGGRDVQISGDGRFIGYMKQIEIVQPDSAKLIADDGFAETYRGGSRYQICIASAEGRRIMATAKGAKFVLPGSFQWSRDGHRFAFLGLRPEEESTVSLFRGDADGGVNVVPLPSLNPRTIVWVDAERFLVSAESMVSSDGDTNKTRRDWWLVSPRVVPRNLTERFRTAPAELLPAGGAFVGVVDGDLWSVNVDSGKWTNLTVAFDPKVTELNYPKASSFPDTDTARVVVSALRNGEREYYRVEVSSGRVKPITRPSIHASLEDYCPKTDAALFTATERTGTYLTIMHGELRRQLVETNVFLRDVATVEQRQVEYRSLDGEELKGWIILPAKNEAGKRYPLVTLVYAGTRYGRDDPFLPLSFGFPLNPWFLTARGYAVLLPSMPLKPYSDGKDNPGSDPYMELTKGVLPAVDKAIELGIADPTRLAVIGHSYGGYSTYGLVTQTNRFKAAIAYAGASDLVSLYGSYDPMQRYYLFPSQENFRFLQWAETGQGRMGNPPWKDWGRYLRNSPLFYVDRVETPLLIVQGDMDYVPIQQGEEFFTALHRQGKRARFIRYWGEGHFLLSPANFRDLWTQVYAWLDEFCDITRDDSGNLVFDGDKLKSRGGAPPLRPENWKWILSEGKEGSPPGKQ